MQNELTNRKILPFAEQMIQGTSLVKYTIIHAKSLFASYQVAYHVHLDRRGDSAKGTNFIHMSDSLMRVK